MRIPTTTITAILATLVSLAWWAGWDMSALMESPMIRRGQWWRLATSALPHVNVLHLTLNLYWLFVFGERVERAFGSMRTAACFLFLAACSGGLEYGILDGGVGLSGVVYGLFAMAWVLQGRDARFAGAIPAKTAQLFVAWFFACIFTTITGVMLVGNIAHGAGAAVGAILGLTAVPATQWQRVASRGLLVFITAATAGALAARPYINLSRWAGLAEGQLGYSALEESRNEDGVRWCSEATRLRPQEASCWFNLGIALERTGKSEHARVAYQRAAQIDPAERQYKDAATKYAGAAEAHSGYTALLEGRNEDAIRWLTEATRLRPEEASFWFNLAIALERTSQAKAALEAYKKAAQLEPANKDYQEMATTRAAAIDDDGNRKP